MEKQRLLWLDIAKGITIILMVLGHSSLSGSISNFIFAFHMPLFFIASGYTTNWSNTTTFQFVVRKNQAVLIPFLIYSIILLLLTLFTNEAVRVSDFLKNGWVSWALWFVPVLFLSLVVCRFIYNIRSKYLQWVCVGISLAIGILLCCMKIYLPWSISTIPIAVTYLYFGSQLRGLKKLTDSFCWWYIPILFVITALVSHFWRLDLCFNKIMPIIPLYIASIAGTLMVFMFSSFIEKHLKLIGNGLIRIGRETFLIVAFSQVIIVLVNDYLTVGAITKYGILILTIVILTVCKELALRVIKNKTK